MELMPLLARIVFVHQTCHEFLTGLVASRHGWMIKTPQRANIARQSVFPCAAIGTAQLERCYEIVTETPHKI
jgi:hypothetical protein